MDERPDLLGRAHLWAHEHRRWLCEGYRSARDLGLSAGAEFRHTRATRDYQAAYDKPNPLVSICIATYNRAKLLRGRSLRSSMEQTYQNIEIIVVGDACTDETEEAMAQVTDPRVRFVNLEHRGDYPNEPELRWMVAGTAPMNHALSIARGDFITHLDDDDEHELDRVEQLLSRIRETRADILYHPFRCETPAGDWSVNEGESFDLGRVTTSSIFYHSWFRRLRWDPQAYRYREPGDWNRLRKFAFLGARSVRHPGVLLSHYRERSQAEP